MPFVRSVSLTPPAQTVEHVRNATLFKLVTRPTDEATASHRHLIDEWSMSGWPIPALSCRLSSLTLYTLQDKVCSSPCSMHYCTTHTYHVHNASTLQRRGLEGGGQCDSEARANVGSSWDYDLSGRQPNQAERAGAGACVSKT